jgi:hypothetical protein
MQPSSSFTRFLRKRILCTAVILSLMGAGIQALTTIHHSIPLVSAQEEKWSLTLQMTEPLGAGNSVVLGGSPSASNGQDTFDLPEPPAPPQLPYIRAWFTTPFSIPYNDLLQEYKHTSSQRMEWNLSILWAAEPGNVSTTTIRIFWDPTQAAESTFTAFQLLEDNVTVANMLTQNSYSFLTNGTVRHFQILAQNTAAPETSEQNTLLVPLILLGIGILIVVILFVLIAYKRKK